ncbi:MAG TPA: hypothetical protein VFD69_02115 [Vicinamibacterales bacterium]|nr:hypothetical protein [Vicinamibacterales bacterium]
MNTSRHRLVWAALFAVVVAAPVAAQQAAPAVPLPREEARERNLSAYVELLRSDLRAQKVAVLTELMQLTEAEDKAFWPIYREYELEQSRLNDERLAGIETYAKVYHQITSATANELAVKSLDLEARRTAVKKTYYTKLAAAVSPMTAAKALQIENQIQLIIDLQVAASLPVLQ